MIEAHGLGGATDLPIPASLAIAGGAAALVLSFVVLLLAWREPRFDGHNTGRQVPAALGRFADSRGWKITCRVVGVLGLLVTLGLAILGPDSLNNPVFGIFYAYLWVGLIPASLLLGPVYRAMSPVRSMHWLLTRISGTDPDEAVFSYPARFGYWPAAIAAFAYVWLELVYPGSVNLGPVRLWIAGYVAAMLVGGAIFGRSWFEHADPFEAFSTVVSHLSLWGRDHDGRLVFLSPLRNLARLEPRPGLVALVAVLLGSTAYDSFRGLNRWVRFVQGSELNPTWLGSAGLISAVAVVGLTFSAATLAATSRPIGFTRRQLPSALAHSIAPIIVGYFIAHYLSFLVEYGQVTMIQLSDPMNNGADLLGISGEEANYFLSLHPTLLASIKVLAIVTGHIAGAVAAHDRALSVLPRRHQVTGQLPLLAAMVLYTYAGLYLLFGS